MGFSRRLLGISAVVALAGIVMAWYALNLRPLKPTLGGQPDRFVVQSGRSLRSVAQELDRTGVIRSQLALRVYARILNRERIVVGTYSVSAADRPSDILRRLSSGETADVSVTLIEGWTAVQMDAALAKAGVLPAGALASAIKSDPVSAPDFLSDKPAQADLEGYLFPDTYKFERGAQASEVLAKLLETFGRRVDAPLREQIRRGGHTLFEAVTLASIVEREVATTADRRMVADLFWRRLKIGQALESDATVNYVTGKGLTSPTFADTKVDSPYNTYVHTGLPPGPIGNPGLDALRAVADPLPNDFLYFLSGKDGKTHFAATYDEHLANKAKYLP